MFEQFLCTLSGV